MFLNSYFFLVFVSSRKDRKNLVVSSQLSPPACTPWTGLIVIRNFIFVIIKFTHKVGTARNKRAHASGGFVLHLQRDIIYFQEQLF
jgi:hypothetical protein